MNDLDINELFRRFAILDAELKEIRRELAEVKQQSCSTAWYQKYGTIGAIAYGANTNKCMWENLPPEDRNKPIGLSCPCSRCTPYSM